MLCTSTIDCSQNVWLLKYPCLLTVVFSTWPLYEFYYLFWLSTAVAVQMTWLLTTSRISYYLMTCILTMVKGTSTQHMGNSPLDPIYINWIKILQLCKSHCNYQRFEDKKLIAMWTWLPIILYIEWLSWRWWLLYKTYSCTLYIVHWPFNTLIKILTR